MIGIENKRSAYISHDQADSMGDLQECRRTIKRFVGQNHQNMYIGTIKWHWEDDQGKIQKMLIPKSYYVQEGGFRLISIQHWDKSQKDFESGPGIMETNNYLSSALQSK